MLRFLGFCTGCFLAVLLLPGCGGNAQGPKPPDANTLSPAEFFDQSQGGTITPHGPIVPGSAMDMGEGVVQYQTEDGSTFQVEARRTEDGYRYQNPIKVEPDPVPSSP